MQRVVTLSLIIILAGRYITAYTLERALELDKIMENWILYIYHTVDICKNIFISN
jgi:propanediol dehydratase small subunit